MAPEQDAPGFDARVDVYALGRVLEDLAAGTRGALASIVARATAVDPAARYAGAVDLAADVRRFADGDAVLAHREGPMERAARFARTYRTPLALVLTYLAVRILLLLWAAR